MSTMPNGIGDGWRLGEARATRMIDPDVARKYVLDPRRIVMEKWALPVQRLDDRRGQQGEAAHGAEEHDHPKRMVVARDDGENGAAVGRYRDWPAEVEAAGPEVRLGGLGMCSAAMTKVVREIRAGEWPGWRVEKRVGPEGGRAANWAVKGKGTGGTPTTRRVERREEGEEDGGRVLGGTLSPAAREVLVSELGGLEARIAADTETCVAIRRVLGVVA